MFLANPNGMFLSNAIREGILPLWAPLYDYGVPYSIVRYYETEDPRIINTFDAYESSIFKKIKDV